MTEMKAAAIITAAAARVTAKVAAMQAMNEDRAARGYAQAYGEEAFLAVIDEEGIGRNAVATVLNEAQS